MKKKKKLGAVEALQKAKGSPTVAARLMGIPRTTFYSRLSGEIVDNPDWRKRRKMIPKDLSAITSAVRAGLPTKTERERLGDFKILMLDIETSPHKGWFWKLHDENISINQLIDSSRPLCFAAKYYGADKSDVRFHAEWIDGQKNMLRAAHDLLSEADAVITQNGERFDFPVLNWYFLKNNMSPPRPYKSIDLIKTTRSRFRGASTKLDYVARELGYKGKIEHEGFPLWEKVMAGDPAAQERFQDYNIGDTLLLEPIYRRYRPWIRNHPNVAAFNGLDEPACPTCGSVNLQADSWTLLQTTRRAQYTCKDCGTFLRERNEKDMLPRTRVVF